MDAGPIGHHHPETAPIGPASRLDLDADLRPRCWSCKAPFTPRRSNQATCGDDACSRAYSHRLDKATPLPERKCAVPDCSVTFIPKSTVHETCSPEHRWKLRDQRRQAAAGGPPVITCVVCGALVEVRTKLTKTCPGACREARKARVCKTRFGAWYAKNRGRVIAAVQARRGSTKPTPAAAPVEAGPSWASPPPELTTSSLPGAMLPIAIAPLPAEALDVRYGTVVHALLTGILETAHDPTAPEWSLLFVGRELSPSGWGVWLRSEAYIAKVAGKSFPTTAHGRPVVVLFGDRRRGAYSVLRPRWPKVTATGRHRVRIDTLTPVVIRQNGRESKTSTRPRTVSLWSALANIAERVGVTISPPDVGIELRREGTHTEGVRVMVKAHTREGTTSISPAWQGTVVLDVNPLGRWLLEVAALIGFGGRTAYGFGRIAVADVATAEPLSEAPPELAPWEVVVDGVAQKFVARSVGSGGRAVSLDEARHVVQAMVGEAVFLETRPSGHEVWTYQDLRFVVGPGPLGTLRAFDVWWPEDEPDQRPAAPAPIVKPHAVERYIERFRQGLAFEAAQVELVDLASQARPGKPAKVVEGLYPEATFWIWRGPREDGPDGGQTARSRVRLLVAHPKDGGRPALVTVFPSGTKPDHRREVTAWASTIG